MGTGAPVKFNAPIFACVCLLVILMASGCQPVSSPSTQPAATSSAATATVSATHTPPPTQTPTRILEPDATATPAPTATASPDPTVTPIPTRVVPPAEPVALPPGFGISVFAQGLSNPRMMTVGLDGQLYVAERGAGRILRLPDRDQDGVVAPCSSRFTAPGIAVPPRDTK